MKKVKVNSPTSWICKKCGFRFGVSDNEVKERKEDGLGIFTYCSDCQKKIKAVMAK